MPTNELVGYDSSSDEAPDASPRLEATATITDPRSIPEKISPPVSQERSRIEVIVSAQEPCRPENAIPEVTAGNIVNDRSAILALTMPTHITEVPSSPSAQPPNNNDRKIRNFLEMKKSEVHFNDRLGSSAALKNPSMLQAFFLRTARNAGQGLQYSTTLDVEARLLESVMASSLHVG